jgi:hypothetical protein
MDKGRFGLPWMPSSPSGYLLLHRKLSLTEVQRSKRILRSLGMGIRWNAEQIKPAGQIRISMLLAPSLGDEVNDTPRVVKSHGNLFRVPCPFSLSGGFRKV